MTFPAAVAPSFPCSRIRRLLAMFNEIRNNVRNNSNVGKTENCAGRNMYSEESNTITPSVMLTARSRSSTTAGTGTIITKISVTVATGTTQLVEELCVKALEAALISLPHSRRTPGGGPRGLHRVPQTCLRPVQKGQYFRNGRVQLCGNGLAHFRGAVESLSERRVFHDGDAVPAGDLPDADRDLIHALGHNHRRGHALRTIFQRHGKMFWVGYHGGRAFDILHRPPFAYFTSQLAKVRAHQRALFRILGFPAYFLLAHLEGVFQVPSLEIVVGARPCQQDQTTLPSQFVRSPSRPSEQHANV